MTVRGEVEVADLEVVRDVGQLPLGTRLQIQEPEIFMLDFSSQEDKASTSGEERQTASPARKGQRRQM